MTPKPNEREPSWDSSRQGGNGPFLPVKPFEERHFSVAEVAHLWNLSKDAVRRIFQNEPGVLVLGDSNPRRRKRRYTTLRIPQSVLERVHTQYELGN